MCLVIVLQTSLDCGLLKCLIMSLKILSFRENIMACNQLLNLSIFPMKNFLYIFARNLFISRCFMKEIAYIKFIMMGMCGTQEHFPPCDCYDKHGKNITLHWHHNECIVVSNHQSHDCLFNRLFRGRSKKTSKLCVTGHCGEFTGDQWISCSKGRWRRKCFHLMTSSWEWDCIYFMCFIKFGRFAGKCHNCLKLVRMNILICVPFTDIMWCIQLDL